MSVQHKALDFVGSHLANLGNQRPREGGDPVHDDNSASSHQNKSPNTTQVKMSEKPKHDSSGKSLIGSGGYSPDGNTRSHSEHDRETSGRRWYYVLRYGRVCGRQFLSGFFLFSLCWAACLKTSRSLLSRSNGYAQSLALRFLCIRLSLMKNTSSPHLLRGLVVSPRKPFGFHTASDEAFGVGG